ncbi:BRO-N domain-containing protein [Clostridium butyricum]|uniref:BRO-N domain-containing protein n=1 Tax=Clostridium butyricum TaxID=1492 RepID=UPI002ABDCF1D|nr:BRO family protein [Clostridium butyricum]
MEHIKEKDINQVIISNQGVGKINGLELIHEGEILGRKIKMYGTVKEPLFLAKDVAEWIDYSYKDSRKIHRDISKMIKSIDDDEKIKRTLNLGGEKYLHGGVRKNTEMWFLTEYGIYEVLMHSRSPIAKGMKKEIKKILKRLD